MIKWLPINHTSILMNQVNFDKYIAILKKELILALGCTEPGAVGYAASKAAEVLGCFPKHIEMRCSANIIKNVKSVDVPNSRGLKGIEAAAILGIISGKSSDSLEIFKYVKEKDIKKTQQLISENFCSVFLQKDESNLYISAIVRDEENIAEVIIKDAHTNIVTIKKNNKLVFSKGDNSNNISKDGDNEFEYNGKRYDEFMTVAGILDFADSADWKELREIMEEQVRFNTAIAEDGLHNSYGANIGKTLIEVYGNDIRNRAKAKAAAGSDARMGGSSLPVVINSGSGNQGITIAVPVVEYAKELKIGEEKLYRAMAIANLISIYIKSHIGKLSAFCGAVNASCGCGAAITYINGGTFCEICSTITNAIANIGGIICDGAKASCAAKISSSVDAAILAVEMTKRGESFCVGEGIIGHDIEKTIDNFGKVGREGMYQTDTCIMGIMLE